MKKRIVVIGAGLAGTLISNKLARKSEVVLLEAGKKSNYSFPKIKFRNKHLGQVKTFCAGEGGTTNLWHNGLIPMLEDDIAHKEFKEILRESSKYRAEAAEKLFWKDNPYQDEYNSICSEMRTIADKLKIFTDGIDCLLYPKNYHKLTPESEVESYYSVKDIWFDNQNNKVKSVGFLSDGKKKKIEFDYLIISAGALGSPKFVKMILKQIGAVYDSVGVGFADHPMGFVGKVKIKEKFNSFIKQFVLLDRGNYVSRVAIRLKSDDGVYTSAVFLRPALSMNNRLSLYKYKSGLGASKGLDRLKYVFSPKLFHIDIISEIISHIFNINIPGRTYNVLVMNDQKRGKNSVSYDEDGINLDWSISGEELSVYNSMLRKFKTFLTPISDKIIINTNITEEWLWSGAHHSGTISLGNGDTDILDKDLKLKAVDNVFVCDGSVIQEHSYANTGLSIGQLALRLADRIIEL